jgi:class 3 adenylate cyclase/tetratricopeptide (TPR) repeat protein
MAACPACGFENASDAKFCSECGSQLAVASRARREERKVVTVVFADLVGSTSRAERLDPEDVRAILRPYHDRLRAELERHGGTVEKFIGDAVVGVFGAPIAHEDDPERAVRAALAIQEAIVEMNEADPTLGLEVRIGVNTGEAIVALDARPELGEAIVAGDVVNTGARIQSAAQPGGILVGEYAYRATKRAVEYEPAAPVVAKGKADPLNVWRAIARRASFGIDLADARSPLVGRDDERDVLAGALARARMRLEPQLVTLVGVPGIGKSRLVRELFRIVDEDPELIVWRQGRSLPYGEGSAFWGLAEIVKAQAGILETDGADQASAKIAAAVSDVVADPTERHWVERHLLSLAGLQQADSGGQASLDEAFAAWRRFLEALAEKCPVVLVFEDLHWADEALLDFVDSVADRVAGVPLLVVCSARPELLERRPDWGGGKRNAATVSLAPLSDEDTARLLAGLLGTPVLPAEQQASLLQRAGGNPLFAEEYARMLADGTDAGVDAPETLQGVVAARIDALPAEEKELLQLAAALGKVFWTDALASLSAIELWELEERLYALERKEFVRREHRSAVAGSRQFVFVHALVRDGAYGQMSRVARAGVHRRVADWIDTLPPDRADDRSEILAHHLLEAIEYSRAAGLDADDLVPRASIALRESGERAWRIGALPQARDFYRRLRAFDPSVEDDPYFLLAFGLAFSLGLEEGAEELERAADALADSDPAAAAQATVTRGEYVWQRGDQDGAFVYFDRARALAEGAPASLRKAHVIAQVARFLALAGRYAESLELVEQAIQMADDLGDDDLLGDALNTRGISYGSLVDPRWEADLERSLEIALRANSFRASRAYLNFGSVLADYRGDLPRAQAVEREGLAFSRRLGLESVVQRWFRGNLAEGAYYLGDWDEALELADEEIAGVQHYMQHSCHMYRARIRQARGDGVGAGEDIETALDLAREIRDPQSLHPVLASAAELALQRGDVESARRSLDALGRPGDHLEAGLWVVTAAFARHGLGRDDEIRAGRGSTPPTPWSDAALAIADGDFARAGDILEGTGARTLVAAARLGAAKQLVAEGRRAEAAAQLAPALAFYREVGASAYVRQAEGLLAAAS